MPWTSKRAMTADGRTQSAERCQKNAGRCRQNAEHRRGTPRGTASVYSPRLDPSIPLSSQVPTTSRVSVCGRRDPHVCPRVSSSSSEESEESSPVAAAPESSSEESEGSEESEESEENESGGEVESPASEVGEQVVSPERGGDVVTLDSNGDEEEDPAPPLRTVGDLPAAPGVIWTGSFGLRDSGSLRSPVVLSNEVVGPSSHLPQCFVHRHDCPRRHGLPDPYIERNHRRF